MSRPIDTENVITNRHRIRFNCCMILFLFCMYTAIRPLFVQPNISWIHYVHVLFQPLLLFLSMSEWTGWVQIGSYLSLALLATDSSTVGISLISISRCYSSPTAYCLGRLYESGVWALLGFFFCLFNLLNFFQLQNLAMQLEEKDIKEAEIREITQIRKISPKFNILKINAHKIHSLHVYLFLQDIIYTVITLAKTSTMPIYWLGLGHVFVDPYIIYIGKTYSKTFHDMSRIVYILLFISNIILIILNTEKENTDIAEWLAFLFLLVYISIDIILFALSSEIIAEHEKIKISKSTI